MMLFLVTLSFDGIWEMIEGFTDSVTGNTYTIWAEDTMDDLITDLLGAVIASAGVHLYLEDHSLNVSSRIGFGHRAFEVHDEND